MSDYTYNDYFATVTGTITGTPYDTEYKAIETAVNSKADIAGPVTHTGTHTFASLVATTADINAGTIDATTIGATTPAAGTFTNVTGTLQTAAQPNVTSLGTLTTLDVDDITINGNAISSSGASSLTLTALAGQAVSVEGVSFDDGAITGISSLSTSGTITGPSGTWSSNGIDLAAGDDYEINNNSVLSETTLGTGVVNSSLTSLGTITALRADEAAIGMSAVSNVALAVQAELGTDHAWFGAETLGGVSLSGSLFGGTIIAAKETAPDTPSGILGLQGETVTINPTTGNLELNTTVGNAFFKMGSVKMFEIGQTGSVSITTDASPTISDRLNVKSDAGNTAIIKAVNSSSDSVFVAREDGTVRLPSTYSNTSTTGRPVLVQSDGELVADNTSSARFKENVEDSDYGLFEVLAMRSVEFNLIDDDKRQLGFIAEEVLDLGMEELMDFDEEGRPETFHYAKLTPVLVKAIQELNAKVDAL